VRNPIGCVCHVATTACDYCANRSTDGHHKTVADSDLHTRANTAAHSHVDTSGSPDPNKYSQTNAIACFANN